jgi:hypothetical protein
MATANSNDELTDVRRSFCGEAWRRNRIVGKS